MMIELDIKNFIDENLDYPAYMELPPNPPDKFFVIEKVGGGQDEHIDTASITIQTYAPSMFLAASIAEELNDAMLNDFILLSNISKVELNSSYNYPDTRVKKYRYQSLFDIYYYGGSST